MNRKTLNKTFVLIPCLCILLAVFAFSPAELSAVKKEITVAAVGDCIISHKVSVLQDPKFLELVKLLRSADCTYGNCETTFFDPDDGFPGWKNYHHANLYCLPYGADELKWMGIDIVSLANNHIMDFDYKGLFSTLDNLKRTGIGYAGAGQDLERAAKAGYIETTRGIVSLVSCCATIAEKNAQATGANPYMRGKPGLNPLNTELVLELDEDSFRKFLKGWLNIVYALSDMKDKDKKDIKDIKKFKIYGSEVKYQKGEKNEYHSTPKKKDIERIYESLKIAANNSRIVIASIHEHVSNDDIAPFPYEIDFAHKCIDLGAHMFVGTGPHVLWGLEMYKGKPIFYSIGNFFFHTLGMISADAYERLGFPADSKDPMLFPEKFYKYFDGFPVWESIVPIVTYDSQDNVKEILLYPIILEKDVPLYISGTPRLAEGQKAVEILERYQKLSQKMNTEIVIKKGVGKVVL